MRDTVIGEEERNDGRVVVAGGHLEGFVVLCGGIDAWVREEERDDVGVSVSTCDNEGFVTKV